MLIGVETYYLLIGTIILLSAFLVGVSLSYFISTKRVSKLEKKEDEIITAAQDQAEKIIGQAVAIHYASENKINQAADKLSDEETKELSEKSAEFVKLFDEKIEMLNTQNIEGFGKVSEDIKKSINLHFDDLKKLLSQQTVESQKLAEEKIKEEYAQLEQELAAYKKSQLDKINNNIYQILLNVSKEVFGKKLDTKEHEEIITKALQEAEKQID